MSLISSMHLSSSIALQSLFLLAEAKTGKYSSINSFTLEEDRLVLAIFNFLRKDLVEDNSMNFSITF